MEEEEVGFGVWEPLAGLPGRASPGGARTKGVKSDSGPLGLARTLVGTGRMGPSGQGGVCVLTLRALQTLSKALHKPQTLEAGEGDA